MAHSAADRWHFGDRWYTLTLASNVLSRDGMGLELDDVAPAPGRGTVMTAFHDDVTGQLTFASSSSDEVPLELVEQFVAEARRQLPPGQHVI